MVGATVTVSTPPRHPPNKVTKSALGSRAQELHEWEMAKMAALLRLQASVGENTGRFTHTPGQELPRSPAQVGPGEQGAEPSLRGPRLGKAVFPFCHLGCLGNCT